MPSVPTSNASTFRSQIILSPLGQAIQQKNRCISLSPCRLVLPINFNSYVSVRLQDCSNRIKMRSVHILRIEKQFLDQIRAKVKTVDVRAVTVATKLIKIDDLIKFVCGSEKVVCRLKWRTSYASLGSCLSEEGVEKVMPGLCMSAALRKFKEWSSFKPPCVAVFAFHLEILESANVVDLDREEKSNNSARTTSGLKRPFKSSSLETGETIAKIGKVDDASKTSSSSSSSSIKEDEIIAKMNSVDYTTPSCSSSSMGLSKRDKNIANLDNATKGTKGNGPTSEVHVNGTHLSHVSSWQIAGYGNVVRAFEPCNIHSVKVEGGVIEILSGDPILAVESLLSKHPTVGVVTKYLQSKIEPLDEVMGKAERMLRAYEEDIPRPKGDDESAESIAVTSNVQNSMMRPSGPVLHHYRSPAPVLVNYKVKMANANDEYDRKVKRTTFFSEYHFDGIVCPYDKNCKFNKFMHRSIKSWNDHFKLCHLNAEFKRQCDPMPDFYIQWNDDNVQRYLQSPVSGRYYVFGFSSKRRDEMSVSLSETKWVDDMTSFCRISTQFERRYVLKEAEYFFGDAFGDGAFDRLKKEAAKSKMDIQCKRAVRYINVTSEPHGTRLLYYGMLSEQLKVAYVGSTVQTFNDRLCDHCKNNEKLRELLMAPDLQFTHFTVADRKQLLFDYERIRSHLEYVVVCVFDTVNDFKFLNEQCDTTFNLLKAFVQPLEYNIRLSRDIV